LAARLAAAMHRHGCDVNAVCPLRHPLTHVTGMGRIYPYGGISPTAGLQRAMRECRPDIVVPCDDGVVVHIHALYDSDPSLRAVIERSLGSPDSYSIVGNRYRLLSLAAEIGIRVPRTRKVTEPSELEEWHKNVSPRAVVKVDGGSGGNGVIISDSLKESIAAFREFRVPWSAATAWKRLVIDRDPLSLWLRRHSSVREVSVQEFIPGRPANSMVACWRGKLLGVVSVVVVAAEGPTGAATVVRVVRNEKMKNAAELIVSRLNLSGFFGLDFIMESGTGIPYLIEMNPRCTQLGHIELAGTGSLAGALCAALKGEPQQPPKNPVRSETIALFPQALNAGDACRRYIEASYHDLPSEDPQLMRELMQESWPRRQWPARLYHALKPPERADPTVFESLDAKAQTVA